MPRFALARTEDINIREVADEVIVHDVITDMWHHLDDPTAAIWRAANGSRDDAALAAVTGCTTEQVTLALDALAEAELVTLPAGLTRRGLMAKSALVGGAAIASPLILSLRAPFANAAASGQSMPGVGGGTAYDLYNNFGSVFTFYQGTVGSHTPVTTPASDTRFNGLTGYSEGNGGDLTPFFVRNTTNGGISAFSSSFPSHSFAVHPPQSGQALIAFTNPSASALAITVTGSAAAANNSGGNGVTVSVAGLSGTPANTHGTPAPVGFTYTGNIPGHGTIYIVIDNNGQYGSDSTILSATVTLV